MKLAAISALALATFAAGSANAAFTTYSNGASFSSAAGPITTETFDDAVTPGVTITQTVAPNDVFSIADGVLHARVWLNNPSINNNPVSTTFTFGSAVTAFGGDWNLGVNGFGQGLNFYVGNSLVGSISDANGFFGFTSDTAFSAVEVRSAGLGQQPAETYDLDNLKFSSVNNVSAVPEPETYAMLIAGLGVLGFMGRRRRA